MNRRDFLYYTATSAGSLAPIIDAISAPCPPSPISVSGGTSASTACKSIDAETDWIARSTGPGVKWAHDFRNQSEFTKFALMNSSQPSSWMTRDTSDGIGKGASLLFSVPAGSHCNHSWPRPFSALPGDVGYISGPDYTNVNNWYQWRYGMYGNQAYHDTQPNFVGTDFYIQFRVKMSSGFFGSNPPGKLCFIDIAGGGDQEIIPKVQQRFDMYTNFGSRSNSYLYEPQDSGSGPYTSLQPGSEYASPPTYWSWPTDEWVTALIHVVPGKQNTVDNPVMNSSSTNFDTAIQVWVARQGATNYTKIWDKQNYAWAYDANPGYGNPFGFNIFTPSAYRNNTLSATDWNIRWGQIIFSTQMIPCPLA